jgi:hypothetical protein
LASEGSVAEPVHYRERYAVNQATAGTNDASMVANLAALADLLSHAANDAREALGHAKKNKRNTAIGTIVDLDQLLADAVALHGATMALHRRSRP